MIGTSYGHKPDYDQEMDFKFDGQTSFMSD